MTSAHRHTPIDEKEKKKEAGAEMKTSVEISPKPPFAKEVADEV